MHYLNKLLTQNLETIFGFIPQKYVDNNLPDLSHLKTQYPQVDFRFKTGSININEQTTIERKPKGTLFFIIDVSGSIDIGHKEHFAGIMEGITDDFKKSYSDYMVKIILHTTEVVDTYTYSSRQLWIKNEKTGGTIVSSGYKEAERFLSDDSDNYLVQLSDGDNWEDDNKTVMEFINNIAYEGKVQGFKYFEITNRISQNLGRLMSKSFVESYFMNLGKLHLK